MSDSRFYSFGTGNAYPRLRNRLTYLVTDSCKRKNGFMDSFTSTHICSHILAIILVAQTTVLVYNNMKVRK